MAIRFHEDPENDRIFLQIGNLQEHTRRSIRQGFFALGQDLKRTANREILRRPKSGRTYIRRTRNGARRRHVASAPGETHANMTGQLRRSIGWIVRGYQSLEFGYGVTGGGPNEPAPDYARIEHGWGRVAPRPSLRNAIDATNRTADQYFNRAFRNEIRRRS